MESDPSDGAYRRPGGWRSVPRARSDSIFSRLTILFSVPALITAIAFCGLTMIHLGAQGAYYDELHQAPAAFEYVGKHPKMFTVTFFDLPSLNMTYSGALKSAVYGVFLRYLHPQFSLYSWRALGIAFVVVGLLGFFALAGRFLATTGSIAFALLFLTDVSVIVMTRHDWGPVALALGLRLFLLGIWLSIDLDKAAAYRFGIAGLVVGLAIFEKLSSIVLLVPFLLLFIRSGMRRSAWTAALLGLLIGLSPLLRANYHTYRTTGTLISLTDAVEVKKTAGLGDAAKYAFDYFSLGQGEMARSVVLDEPTNSFFSVTEGAMILVTIIMIPIFTWILPRNDSMRLASTMAATYVLVGVALFLLPKPTFAHHWILGTPFQYCSIALASIALEKMVQAKISRATNCRLILAIAVMAIIVTRLPNLVQVEISLASGKASPHFDPAFNRLAEFAAKKSNEAFFLAADWGTGTQIYCGTNGEEDTVGEPFWSPNPVKAALDMARGTKKSFLYVVESGLGQPWTQVSKTILASIRNSPNWSEVQLDPALKNLGPIEIHEFHR